MIKGCARVKKISDPLRLTKRYRLLQGRAQPGSIARLILNAKSRAKMTV